MQSTFEQENQPPTDQGGPILTPNGKMHMSDPNDIRFECPNCKGGFGIPGISTFAEAEGATCDCPNCGDLLLFAEDALVDFHKTLHAATDGRWPIDGEGTGVIELSEERVSEEGAPGRLQVEGG